MKNMGAVTMDNHIFNLFAIDIAADMGALFQNKAGFSPPHGFMGKNSSE
jgi:hypothetical protein